MTERFTMTKNEFLTSFEDNGVKMTHQQIVNTLNDLNNKVKYDERVQNEALGVIRNQRKTIDRLNKENEQLKLQLKDCQIKFREFNNHMIGEMK